MYVPQEIRIRYQMSIGIRAGSIWRKWKSRVICVLADKKTLRYSELRAELVNITDAVLSTTLKALIADDIVSRNHMMRFRQELNIHLRKRAYL